MSIGDAWSSMLGSTSKGSSFALLDAFTSAGSNFIGTANVYQDEQSKAWLGERMTLGSSRYTTVIATKFTLAYKDYTIGIGVAPNYMGSYKKAMTLLLRASLGKLQPISSTSSTCTCRIIAVASRRSCTACICSICRQPVARDRAGRARKPTTFSHDITL